MSLNTLKKYLVDFEFLWLYAWYDIEA